MCCRVRKFWNCWGFIFLFFFLLFKFILYVWWIFMYFHQPRFKSDDSFLMLSSRYCNGTLGVFLLSRFYEFIPFIYRLDGLTVKCYLFKWPWSDVLLLLLIVYVYLLTEDNEISENEKIEKDFVDKCGY